MRRLRFWLMKRHLQWAWSLMQVECSDVTLHAFAEFMAEWEEDNRAES